MSSQLRSLEGQLDQDAPLISRQARAYLGIALIFVSLALAWHLTLAATGNVNWLDPDVTLKAVMRGRPFRAAQNPVVIAVLALLAWMLLVGVWFSVSAGWSSRRNRRRSTGFASKHDLTDGMSERRARASAEYLRPDLDAKARRKAGRDDVGLHLGRSTTGVDVVLPLEDHVAVVGPTGSGKTSQVLIPAALSTPLDKPLIVTSTKGDILTAISEHRQRKGGRVWVFDPADRLNWAEAMTWNPVLGCQDGATAVAMGNAFVAAMPTDKGTSGSTFFRTNASIAVVRLLHAAALSGRDMTAVVGWAMNLQNGAEEPQQLIRESTNPLAEPLWPGMLRNVATGGDQTVASSRQTLAQALEPMSLASVLAWTTPQPGVPSFDPAAFLTSNDTLILCADVNASTNVAPLTAMLFQRLQDEAKKLAAKGSGRLSPPIRVVGDEIGNVAPLPKLPEDASDLRGRIQLLIGLQSVAGAKRRWPGDGAAALLDNMNAELLLGGISDPDTLKRYSQLVGDVDLQKATTSIDRDGWTNSSSLQTQTKTVLRPEEVRLIPDRQALVVYRNRPATILNLTPWYEQRRQT